MLRAFVTGDPSHEIGAANGTSTGGDSWNCADVNDAKWLQQSHQYGLLRGSFRRAKRSSNRKPTCVCGSGSWKYAAAHIQHLQKSLMRINIQLRHAVTDIPGVTGMRIIRALVAGERSPEVLSAHRDLRCVASDGTLRAALRRADRRSGEC